VTATYPAILGGVGLFLLGMILMTDGLKAIAGDALRRLLARFTGNRLSAVATGAGITLVVQSSTATTLATIGFVSAGLLAFENSIGVIIGANLGTTSTGWIVSLLGMKFSMGPFAMPLVGIGAVMRLLGRDRLAETGNVLAGFGLIFVGIDALQAGMSGLSDRFDLAAYGGAGIGVRLLLVGIGIVMTVIMQSSSAAVATTLTAAASGTIGLDQAAALVIGQHIGTTFTAVLAAVGASVAARRTACVHVIFNAVVAVVVFFFLPWLIPSLESLLGTRATGADHALVIAAFHTAFSLFGAILFIPLVPQLARFVRWLLPEQRSALTRHLDPSLREVPALAIAASVSTLRGALGQALAASGRGLVAREHTPYEQYTQWQLAARQAGELVERLPTADARTVARLADTLHLLDHVRQFVRVASLAGRDVDLEVMPALHDYAVVLGQGLLDSARELEREDGRPSPALLTDARLDTLALLRTSIMDAAATGRMETDAAMRALNAQRWLEQIVHHVRRALHYLKKLDDGRTLSVHETVDTGISG
jgi:phosphate:Na+ symporter